MENTGADSNTANQMKQILYVECVLLAARDEAEQASSRLRVVKTRTGQLVDIRFENNVRGLCSMLPVRPKREKARPSQTKKSYFTTIRLTFTTIPLRSDKSLCCQRLKLKIVCTLVFGESVFPSVGTGKIKLVKSNWQNRSFFALFFAASVAHSEPPPGPTLSLSFLLPYPSLFSLPQLPPLLNSTHLSRSINRHSSTRKHERHGAAPDVRRRAQGEEALPLR